MSRAAPELIGAHTNIRGRAACAKHFLTAFAFYSPSFIPLFANHVTSPPTASGLVSAYKCSPAAFNMYIIAHKLYEAQKRPGSLLIQCPMDHQECSEHVVISPKEAVVGAGREVIWRSKPYMGLEVILPHHNDPHRPFKGGKLGACVVLTISCSTTVWDHRCIKSYGMHPAFSCFLLRQELFML